MSAHFGTEVHTEFVHHNIPPFSLNQLVTPQRTFGPYPISPQTSQVIVRLARPITAAPRNWDASSKVVVTIRVAVDGTVYECRGGATGGVRTGANGDHPWYALTYQVPWGRLGFPDGEVRRVGETGRVATAQVILDWVSGTIESEGEIAAVIEPARIGAL